MTDTLDLEDRLRDLAAATPTPLTPLEEDLARGRSRLRRSRLLITGGAATGVAAIALTVGLTSAALDSRDSSPTGPATQGVEPATPKPKPTVDDRTGGELLQDYRNILAEHLDPDGEHLQVKPDNVQAGGGLGTKLRWRIPGEEGLGMVEIFVGDGWAGFVGDVETRERQLEAICGDGVECTQQDVDGIHATVARTESVTTVLVKRDDGSNVLITANELFGNNSLVPVSSMDISIDDLIRAAGDLRLVEATPEQLENARTSMGFPEFDVSGKLEQGQSSEPVAPR